MRLGKLRRLQSVTVSQNTQTKELSHCKHIETTQKLFYLLICTPVSHDNIFPSHVAAIVILSWESHSSLLTLEGPMKTTLAIQLRLSTV